MEFKEAWSKAKDGEKVFYNGSRETSYLRKGLCHRLKWKGDPTMPVSIDAMLSNFWEIEKKATTTTVTTETGRKIELSIKDAEKLNLL